jgi:hypothetical protein
VKTPPKRKKKAATVPSPAIAGKRRRRTKAEKAVDEMIEASKRSEPWTPPPPTRDYEGESRRGSNVAAVRDSMETAGEMVGVIYSDAIHAEGAEKFAAECLGQIAEGALKLLGKVADRTDAPAAEYAQERLTGIAKRMKAMLDRPAQRRSRAKKGVRSREAGERFRKWVEHIIRFVDRRRGAGQKEFNGVRLPDTPFAKPGALTSLGKDPKPGWEKTLMQIIEVIYKAPGKCPDGVEGKWINRRRHAQQIIQSVWKRHQDERSEEHRRWVSRDQTGDY